MDFNLVIFLTLILPLFYVVGQDNKLCVWSVDKFGMLCSNEFSEKKSEFSSFCYNEENQLCLTGSDNGYITFWLVQSGSQLHRFKGHDNAVSCISFVQFSKLKSQQTQQQHRNSIAGNSLEVQKNFFPNYNNSSMANMGSMALLSMTGGNSTPMGMPNTASSKGEPYLITGGFDGKLGTIILTEFIRQGTKPCYEYIVQAHECEILCVIGNHLDNTFLSAGNDGVIKIWTKDLDPVSSFKAHKQAVTNMVMDGYFLFTASDDLTIAMWDIKSKTKLKVLTGHENDILDLTIVPDSGHLLSAGRDGIIKLWDYTLGSTLFEYKRNNTEFNCMYYNKKSRELYAGTSTGVILRIQLDKKSNELTEVVPEDKFAAAAEVIENEKADTSNNEPAEDLSEEAEDEDDDEDDDDEDDEDNESIGEVPDEFDDDNNNYQYGKKKQIEEPPIELGPTPFDKIYKGTVGSALPTFVTKSRLLENKQLNTELWKLLKKQQQKK